MLLDGFPPLQNWIIFTPWRSKTPPYDDVTVPVVADVFCRCHGFSAVAGIHLVVSFPALTAIPAVADGQCYAVACFPVVAEVLLLLRSFYCWFPCCSWCPYCCWLTAFTGVLLWLPCCCLHLWCSSFYWRSCNCFFTAVASISAVTGIPAIASIIALTGITAVAVDSAHDGISAYYGISAHVDISAMMNSLLWAFLLLYDDLSLPFTLYWRSFDEFEGLESSSDLSIQWRVTPAGV